MRQLPFIQHQISDNTFIREFIQDTHSDEFEWHRDREDRIVESLECTDWLIQLDNQLPQKIEGEVFIPKEVYHRVIKGTGNLKVKLQKIKS